MDNPTAILETLDKHLDHEVSLVIYGRAAIWLGFNPPPLEAASTQDVDVIVSLTQEAPLSSDSGFWDAIEATNRQLAARGLYITHLFSEREIFLRRLWEQSLVLVPRPALRWLRLRRPATIDLVLSKMMRGNDPQDMADASFMIHRDRISQAQLQDAFSQMNPIELIELRDAFEQAKPIILKLAQDHSTS